VTLTATVTGSGASPTGTVAFLDGTKLLGTQSITGGTATFSTPFSSQGTHALTARYYGDSVNAESSGTLSQVVTAATASTTTLNSTTNPSIVGPVSLSVTVTGNSPMGAVDLFLSDKVIATATLTSTNSTTSVASFQPVLGQLGSFNLKATYRGDAANFSSSSAVVVQVVDRAATTSVALTTAQHHRCRPKRCPQRSGDRRRGDGW
jgi:hypothetical protein